MSDLDDLEIIADQMSYRGNGRRQRRSTLKQKYGWMRGFENANTHSCDIFHRMAQRVSPTPLLPPDFPNMGLDQVAVEQARISDRDNESH